MSKKSKKKVKKDEEKICYYALSEFRAKYKNLKRKDYKKSHKPFLSLENKHTQEIYDGDKWVEKVRDIEATKSPDYVVFVWHRSEKKTVLRVIEFHKAILEDIISKRNGFVKCWRIMFGCEDVNNICDDYKFILIPAKLPANLPNFLSKLAIRKIYVSQKKPYKIP